MSDSLISVTVAATAFTGLVRGSGDKIPIVFTADVASIRVEEDLNDDSNLLQDLSNAFDVQPAYPC